MAKQFLKKYLPDPEKIRNNKSLGFLGKVLHEPNLWHLNRHCVAKACAIGLFWGSIPMPFQMVPAAICAVRFNANLALSMLLVWFTNPITMPPIFYFEYLVGSWVLGMEAMEFHLDDVTPEWIAEQLYQVGVPLYFGAVLCGVILSSVSFLLVGFLWKWNVRKRWAERQASRQAR